jgi:asparagine synthase (glutamine-hydrolysing)
MRDAMIPRGPDGEGFWMPANQRIALAHRRLAILDLSPAAGQPMSSFDGTFRIVFNGEIYNHAELRKDLECRGHRFATTSDTEVLLALYRDQGEDMIARLRGMYAFAIWDQTRQGLFLARDPFGIKPLYYCDDGHTLRVASQVRALLAGGAIDRRPQSAGHVGFFLFGYVPEPYTLYESIQALPAGSYMWADESGHLIRPFATVARTAALPKGSFDAGDGPTHVNLREAMLDSVRHHLIADVPVGVFLSSGLDSCTLTALASELISDALQTLTLGFEEFRGTISDETRFASLVSNTYGTNHRNIWISRRDFELELDHLLDAMDQPSIDGVNTYFVAKTAAESGLKVALSGVGGDELFGGYSGFRRIPKMVEFVRRTRIPEWAARTLRRVSGPLLERMGNPKYAAALEFGSTFAGSYFLSRCLYFPWELNGIFEPEFLWEGTERLQIMNRLEESARQAGDDRWRISLLEMQWYMRNQLLRDSDWAGMAHSIEIRVPLLDLPLWTAVQSIGATQGWPAKTDMALTPARRLPGEILNRPKSGFAIPVRDWAQCVTGLPQEASLRSWAKFVYSRCAGCPAPGGASKTVQNVN